ncbi:hypothetical protein AJ88_21270 [Mesorhizobium amorphae CCBAU 01583]|nr:hypothetical protein AJ88_21270 [Mesorhizobium amorphae CCBAU 01583]
MKSIVIHAAKDLRIEETDPGILDAGQVEIAVEAGGICGSDLHYYNHGGFGVVRLREPMILGHEVAGTVKALGAGVSSLAVGDRVAISPSRPCNACRYCLQGMQTNASTCASTAAPCRCPISRARSASVWSPRLGNATESPTMFPSTRPPSPSLSRSRCTR